jgi:putative oxidoreductase
MPISDKEKAMKIAVIVARILLGLIFLIFGLNGFLNFLHLPMPPGPAGQYMGVLFASHYLAVVCLVEVIGGALLLSGQFIPLALVLLGPVVFNILLFHTFLFPAGVPPALVTTILWFIVFYGVRHAFAGIFVQKV